MRAEATQGAESLHSQGGSAGAPSSSDLASVSTATPPLSHCCGFESIQNGNQNHDRVEGSASMCRVATLPPRSPVTAET